MKIYKGDILFATDFNTLESYDNSYLVEKDGKVVEILKELNEEYTTVEIIDHTGKLIIPAFCDMHLHAPQFYQRGIGMDRPLLEWLETYTFPNESRFSDLEYAKEVYEKFIDELIKNGTLSSSMFATIHKDATSMLYKMLDEKGLNAFVGKVNMDDNCPDYIREESQNSLSDTREFIEENSYSKTVKPIITPRFSPSCTEDLHKGLGDLAVQKNIPVQSHLCETHAEIKWVSELFPNYKNYASVYEKNNLLGQTKTLMAHCVHLNEQEIKIMRNENIYAVHCPDSNINIISGIMPVKKLVNAGVKVCLGSDIGGGEDVKMYKAMASAIKSSKVLQLTEPDSAINVVNALYLATKAGGEFFGKLGSFEQGYDMTALVIDDSKFQGFSISNLERLERFLYLGDDRNIVSRYICGKSI